MDLEKLRQAADDAGWLVARGYSSGAVADFVAQHRELDADERRLLACAARLRGEYAKHIARELELEDIAKRPVRVDASSVLGVVDAALSERVLCESPAGVLADPSWQRDSTKLADFDAAFERIESVLRTLRPSVVRWTIDKRTAFADRLAERVRKAAKPKSEVALVDDVTRALDGAAFVASTDPSVLDHAASWVNLVAQAISGTEAKIVRLEG
jgi:hypothetical protein